MRCVTLGYLRLKDFHDLENAARVEVVGIPERRYVQKAVMRITMPGASAEVRKTIAVLLNELFVTLYPDDWEYIAAVTSLPEGEACPAVQYEICGSDEECIYIIEDSQIDIGLLASVERNIERCLEIIADYLSWHQIMLLPPPAPVESEPLPVAPVASAKKDKKKCFLMRFFGWIKNKFRRKKKGTPVDAVDGQMPVAPPIPEGGTSIDTGADGLQPAISPEADGEDAALVSTEEAVQGMAEAPAEETTVSEAEPESAPETVSESEAELAIPHQPEDEAEDTAVIPVEEDTMDEVPAEWSAESPMDAGEELDETHQPEVAEGGAEVPAETEASNGAHESTPVPEDTDTVDDGGTGNGDKDAADGRRA